MRHIQVICKNVYRGIIHLEPIHSASESQTVVVTIISVKVSTSLATTEPLGLSQSDKIALGVGIAFGIPTALAAIVALYRRWHECFGSS